MSDHGTEGHPRLSDDEDLVELRVRRPAAVVLAGLFLIWTVFTVAVVLLTTCVVSIGFAYAWRDGLIWGLALYAALGAVVTGLVIAFGILLVVVSLSMAASVGKPMQIPRYAAEAGAEVELEPTESSCVVGSLLVPAALVAAVLGLAVPASLGPLDTWGRTLAEAVGLA
ncbi:hypothetical protein [Yinghuangia soli]|uniref:Uncharacterized protein n=1 Tax=Yinghuangia soli TaxID=2908204 RepID=A0AA41Q3V7_9ACTN|nr:hypothetical protein [Yinghuangia soli]MCF2531048.1 hypothetical protein [Yinghuangia soli]